MVDFILLTVRITKEKEVNTYIRINSINAIWPNVDADENECGSGLLVTGCNEAVFVKESVVEIINGINSLRGMNK